MIIDDFKRNDTDISRWAKLERIPEYAAKLLNNPNVLYVTKDDLTDRVGLIDEAKESGKDIGFSYTALHEKNYLVKVITVVQKSKIIKSMTTERNEVLSIIFIHTRIYSTGRTSW